MTVNPALLLLAVAPAVLLLAVGLTSRSWPTILQALPATLFSLGIALLAVVLVVVVGYGVSAADAMRDSTLALAGFPLAAYAGTFLGWVRRANISTPQALAFGVVGLVPLYVIGGYVLMLSACSFGTGGC